MNDVAKQPCGECTLCCKLLEIYDDEDEIISHIDVYCRHCETGKGCSIYKDRPTACKIYQCMWSQMENVGEELRPDKCRVIFDRAGVDVLSSRMEEGTKLSPLVMGQIKKFNKEGFSVLVFRSKDSKYFLAENHSEEYVRNVIDGRAELHRRPD